VAGDDVRGGGCDVAGALRTGEEFHETGGGQGRREERGGVASRAGDGFGREATAADGAFHGGGPAGEGPIASEIEVVAGGVGGGAEAVEAGSYGEGGAGFFEDSGLEELGFADGWEEAGELNEREGEDLFGGLAEFAERGADD